ncbi:MAG: HAMP domain-containing histidine kinase [Acidimicrobiales bacterium]|nr:HAMP domain-containing histidine kinase [Acidimicrobiales bacterium]
MRRRLTVAMILMVLVTLVLSGLVSLAVAVHNAQVQTRKELVREGQGLALSVQQEANAGADPARSLHTLLTALQSPLRLGGSAVLAVRPDGALFDPSAKRPLAAPPTLPGRLSPSDIDVAALVKLQTVSGTKGTVVFAAVPYQAQLQVGDVSRSLVQVVVLTRQPPSALASAGPWFLLSALIILAVAAIVAHRLGRRFVRPIQAAQAVTSRIAAGDLDARVPDPPGADPELAALADSINSMASHLAQAKDAERHFLQSVTHDLRTPLTSIRGFAEAIEDGATADAVAAAGVIASEARRLERLVGDLLSLAALEARRFTLQPQLVELGEAGARTADGFVPAASDLGLVVTVLREEPCWVWADPDRLAQVAANLIENALRYAAHEVQVTATLQGGQPELWVSDDGPGISAGDLARVFERLFVSRPRPDRPVGSGLGLTIVAELVRAMGGTVRAESPLTPNGGTRIVVSLPQKRSQNYFEVGEGPPAGFAAASQTNPSVGNRPPSTGVESAPNTRSSTVA